MNNMLSYITVISLFLIKISNVTSISIELYRPYDLFSDYSNIKVERDVQFHLYTRFNTDSPYILQYDNETSLIYSPFNKQHPTVIFIHGFGESALGLSGKTLSDAYLNLNEYNIIRVDWSAHSAMPSYITAAHNTKIIGTYVAYFIDWLRYLNTISLSKLHVIGFSLGAHVAGFMAKELAPERIGRITGLDPAGPKFEHKPPENRLDKSDAIFVDIIHTNSKMSGMALPIGHSDFYPNYGATQPGCKFPDIVCSHRRAWALFAETVLNERGFPASKCKTWWPNITHCTETINNFMGLNVDHEIQGIFLLNTNSESPFAKNMTDYSNYNNL